MPDPHSGARGDLLVEAFIEVPKKFSKKQQELLRELAALEDKEITPKERVLWTESWPTSAQAVRNL